jgi:S1-C subfamily serine protease
MRAWTASLVALSSLLVVSSASAQSALERLERRLADPDDAEGRQADDGAEPGYLGAVLDGRATEGRGVEVVEVVPGGPADEAGLQPGDLIRTVDDRRIRVMDDMAEALEPLGPGTEVSLGVDRDSERLTVAVTLGERPPRAARRFPDFGDVPAEASSRRVRLGIAVREVDEETAERLGLAEPIGVLVHEIVVGSPADRAGIPLQAVIVAVNGEELRGPEDLAALLDDAQPGDELTVDYLSNDRRSEAVVVLEAAPPEGEAEERVGPEDDPPATRADDELLERIETLEEAVRELLQRIERMERARQAQDESL